ncbi:MAG: WecB/TagA/CpsF family glycosyltransferase [Lachnospiraceae bacterium]|nr:WecB/TagA/CpsF family glycosyltransferase [Lachnospiraceae bacterium]
MREHYFKKVNVLGIDVTVMRPEKAVNVSMELMRKRGMETIFFLSAESSLYCENQPWAAEFIQSCHMVLTGDRHTEMAAAHNQNGEENSQGMGQFANDYLKRLLTKLNREHREIFAVMKHQDYLDSLKAYLTDSYPSIQMNGIVFEDETDGESDKVVNEINANIPDLLFLCLPVEQQLMFIKEYSAMMNTGLCICIESIQPMIRKETEEIPKWMHSLHLDGLYRWMRKEEKVRKTIVGSIFKNKVLNDVSEEESKQKSDMNQ